MLFNNFLVGGGGRGGAETESIERDIEGQAFLWSFDSAPPTPPPPASKLDRRHTRRLRTRVKLPTGDGRGAESYT